ncbi:unnamed protein product [Candidula unifasciata]|uniref:TLC domain-containing protein n=1 Tax=Candidula unifasciata TaxID=100452 RepID=A0A8S4A1E9_9EUPU|nr:unnamed protein product [Candidula unifasciata]
MDTHVFDTKPEIWREVQEPNYSLIIIVVSLVLFYILSLIAASVTPLVARKSAWKWKNFSASFIHALISSAWAMICFFERPDMAEDLITVYTPLSHSLVSFSVGYFIFDAIALLGQRDKQAYELVGHHAVIICCFMVPVLSHHYVGYAVVALMVEWNSIFLHLRQLLQICGVSKLNAWYRLNSLTNLATFIVFRILLLAWMTRWIVINKDHVPLVFYTMGSVGLAIMVVMNIVLFYRLLRSDFVSLRNSHSDLRVVDKPADE